MRDMLAATMGNVIRIDVAPAGDTWPALVDANQLELAVLNLAINARDAMPLGGTLGITMRNLGDGTAPDVAWPPDLERGDYVCVSVSDTGTGMAPDVLARACEPFFTTKEVGRGSGLGLSQVYGFAKQAGGTVRIESEQGKGTTVHLYLARARRAARDAPASRGAAARTPSPLHILVVDDDDDVRGLMAAGLHGLGHRVAEARSAPEALSRLEAEPSAFDLVIADFAMPGMNGAELLAAVRRLDATVAGLLVTGYADTSAGVPSANDVHVLRKPFKLGDLGGAVEEAVAQHDRQRANGRVLPFRPARR
jgi:CheY-like chemotaxis protein